MYKVYGIELEKNLLLHTSYFILHTTPRRGVWSISINAVLTELISIIVVLITTKTSQIACISPERSGLFRTRRSRGYFRTVYKIPRENTASRATKFWAIVAYSISCKCTKTDKLRPDCSGRKKSMGLLVRFGSIRYRTSTLRLSN